LRKDRHNIKLEHSTAPAPDYETESLITLFYWKAFVCWGSIRGSSKKLWGK